MKNITKKILSVLMVLAVLFVISSCDEIPEQTTNSSPSESTSSSEESSKTESKETTASSENTSSSETTKTEETTSSSETTDTKPHEHVFGEWTITKNATCTENGERQRACSCGEKQTEVLKATDHAWDDGKVTKEPTETETGIKTFTCANCKETKTESIPVLSHTHKHTATVTVPTCTEKGYTTYTCTCGDSYIDNYVDAKGHTESVIKGKEATCTESGLTDGKKCSVCNLILVQQETVVAKGHAWDDGKVTKEPTETETGIKTFTCANCKETKTEPIPVLSHTHKHTATVTAPTCTEKGFTTYTCTCGDSYIDNYVDAKGHTESVIKGKEATCTESGLTDGKKCSVCNLILVQQETVAAKGHAWDDGKVTKEPTETETGIKTFACANCKETKTESIPVLSHTHKHTATVTAPTCTEKGFTTHKCACGDSYIDNYVDAKGHSMGAWKQTKAPSCTVKGEEKSNCANCNHFETREIAPFGHTYKETVTKPTCTEKGYTTHTCACGDSYVDSYVEAKGHAWDDGKVTKEPTETETGIKTFTCANCKETKTESIPVIAHTHKYTSTVTKPTCTEKGFTTHHCACGDSYVDSYVNAKGHTESVIKGKEPTCTESGLTNGKKCSVCDVILVQQETVAAKGHAWDDGKVTKEPTETKPGIKTFSCANCKETKTESIPVIAHTHKYTSTVTKPTCTEKGFTTHHCACGDSYVDSYVNAKGHTESVIKGKEATCLKTGLTEKISCSVCKTVLKEQTLIPKKDHKFDAQGCSVCGITFADNDGYNCLATFQNGKALQAFYNELDRIASEFHTSGKNLEAVGAIAMVGYVCESDFGLTLEEAILAFSFYKNDHPNYFWIYPGYGTTTTGNFALITAAEYCSAVTREKHEKLIHDALNEYLSLVKDEDSAYEMALAFHDKIITNTVYSKTEEDMETVWAHNIIGVLEKGNGVCESYAKTFQLLLNCVGIENVYVSGISYGVNHVWNLIQLDDGKWYWCDLTWDDDENNALGIGWGISYNYFCVTDTQDVLRYYQDGGYMIDRNGDGKQDTENINGSHILEFSQHLPGRSNKIFDGSLRDTFTVDGLQFAISGYRTVQFVYTEKTGIVDIPATVEYEGVTYKVTSVGGIKEDGIYSRNPVAPHASKLNLPKSIVYVWEGAIKK